MFLALALAISFTPDSTIWSWTQLKFEFLLQATPVFGFGLYSARMKSTPALAGMFVGCATAVGIYVASISIPFGLNAGLVGLAVNSVVLVGGSYASGRDEETERASAILEYNSIEFPSESREAEYVLPAQRKVFWVGLAVVLALLVPWYAPESWNAQTALRSPHLGVGDPRFGCTRNAVRRFWHPHLAETGDTNKHVDGTCCISR